MTARKRLTTGTRSLRNASPCPDIIWSSSDSSSDELFIQNRKRSVGTKWIQVDSNETPAKKFKEDICTTAVIPSSSNVHSFEESPIIGNFLRDMSPALTQRQSDDEQTSPVLAGRRINARRVKRKLINLKKNIINPNQDTVKQHSPELFNSQVNDVDCLKISQALTTLDSSFEYNIDKSSPIESAFTEVYHIDNIQTQDSEKFLIQSVSSQDVTEVKEESLIGDIPTKTLLKTKPPKRKKRLKKGSLSEQLHNTLHRQEGEVAIWSHEMYLSKRNNTQYIIPDDLNKILNLRITSFSFEYEGSLLECDMISNNKISCSLDFDQASSHDRKCLVIVNSPYLSSIDLFVGNCFQVYPPYYKTQTTYKNIKLTCYLNITKLMPI